MGKKRDVDDRFNKFGTVSFTAITKTNDFIKHLEDGRVTGTKCLDCGAVFFPPRADCCHCLSSNMEWFEVSGKGKLAWLFHQQKASRKEGATLYIFSKNCLDQSDMTSNGTTASVIQLPSY